MNRGLPLVPSLQVDENRRGVSITVLSRASPNYALPQSLGVRHGACMANGRTRRASHLGRAIANDRRAPAMPYVGRDLQFDRAQLLEGIA